MRSILLHISDDPCLEARIQVAFDLARAFDGHVTCLQPVPFEYGVLGDMQGAMAAQYYPVIKEIAEKLREVTEARLVPEDVPWDWIETNGMAGQQIVRHADLSDIIVMGACTEAGQSTAYSAIAASVAIDAGTPVFLVPEKCKGFDISSPALVAWNGSPEASRALRAATPMLRRSGAVFLACVSEEEQSFDLPAINGASYLSRHDIGATVVELPVSGTGIGDTLMHAAKAREVGWVVMGAYGHTRFRERILGGVSRSMMTDPELPILLAH